MLIRFIVSNFLSFDEEREFNMLAGAFKTHKHHVYSSGKLDLLKSAAIYGANGAGKSNLIKAIDFLQSIVLEGGIKKSVNDKKFKLNKSNVDKPISFEIEFSYEKKIYSYGVSLNQNFVTEEWLYESGVTTEAKMIFERKLTKSGKQELKLADKYQKTPKQKLLRELMEESLLKSGELFLSKSEELKIDTIESVRSFISKRLIIIYPNSKSLSFIPQLVNSKKFSSFANELLQAFDTGVTELAVESIDIEKYFGSEDIELKAEIIEKLEDGDDIIFESENGSVLITKEDNNIVVKKMLALHVNNEGQDISFDLENESDGTKRLLDFIPAFDKILQLDVTFIIDEIDQSLHPALLKALVTKIMSDETTKGQLIFTTHESYLLDLDIFRQDEIWFVEKDKKTGSSQIYSLSDFKPRYDLDIRKGYLKGRFGAIPFLAKLEDLKWQSENV